MEKKIKIFDTTSYPSYEEYLNDCYDCEVEPHGKDSNAYWDWVNNRSYWDWEDFQLMMGEYDFPVIISGGLGLWNGYAEIYPTRCEDLLSAILRCADNDDLIVEYDKDNGCLLVSSMHHDGTNYYTINRLSKAGIRVSDNWCTHNGYLTDYDKTEVLPYMIRKLKL